MALIALSLRRGLIRERYGNWGRLIIQESLQGIILETAVGRARVGCDAVCWQGVTTLRAHAREEEQRRQRAVARLNRVRSALTQMGAVIVVKKVNVLTRLLAEASGQLPFLGSACVMR